MKVIQIDNLKIGDIRNKQICISSETDMMNLIADVGYQLDCNVFILNEDQFTNEFFDLSTKILGHVLQKCKTYNVRLAIIGDYKKYNSNALHDFIYESNKGSDFYFVETETKAIDYLKGE